MACLLTLFMAIPPVQRATMGYNHLASVSTSCTAELKTSKEVVSFPAGGCCCVGQRRKNSFLPTRSILLIYRKPLKHVMWFLWSVWGKVIFAGTCSVGEFIGLTFIWVVDCFWNLSLTLTITSMYFFTRTLPKFWRFCALNYWHSKCGPILCLWLDLSFIITQFFFT